MIKRRGERGSVLVIVAVTLTALLGMGMIVVDVANWWVHKRHLQSQADGAALAGAQLLRAPCNAAANTSIAQEVQRYAGTTAAIPGTTTGTSFTQQISLGGGESVLGVLNSKAYPDSQAGAASDTEANSAKPCTDNAVDVKLTDKNVPYLFLGGALPHINVHARVGLFQASSVTGVLPFGITDPTPQTVVARLVSDSGSSLASDITLTQAAPGSDPGEFDSAPVNVSVPAGDATSTAISGAKTGDYSQPPVNVRIAASGGPPPISAACSGTAESCYPSTSGGLIQLRGWPQHAPTSADVAVIHSVQLSGAGGGCGADGYFTRIPTTASPCSVTVTVTADFQAGVTPPASAVPPKPSDQAIVCLASSTTAFVTTNPNGAGACGNGAAQLTRGTDTPAGDLTWTGSVPVPDETTTTGPTFLSVWGIAQNGTVTFNGVAKPQDCSKTACVQSPIKAQKIFSGSYDLSGYLNAVAAVDPSSYNMTQCTTAPCPLSLQLRAHFQQLQPAQNAADPVFTLHLSSSQNNQSIDCQDPGANTRDMIANGCQRAFRQWTASDVDCAAPSTSYGSMTSPYPCAAKGPGTAEGQVGQGLQARITGGNTCPTQYRNHWTQYPWTGNTSLPLNDHRLVPVFITRFGGFSGAGGAGSYVRVTGFALFYITGWHSSGSNDDPCTTGAPGPGATVDDTVTEKGAIVGHYVNLPDLQFTPNPSNNPCDLSTLSLCVPVLTD
jgi:hypothetical protein